MARLISNIVALALAAVAPQTAMAVVLLQRMAEKLAKSDWRASDLVAETRQLPALDMLIDRPAVFLDSGELQASELSWRLEEMRQKNDC